MSRQVSELLRQLKGQPFWKMTGSGNDFVFVDARGASEPLLTSPEVIQAICHRGNGIGADGIVLILEDDAAAFAIRYFNADGSLASLCGNATLCATRLGTVIGAADPSGFLIATDAGVVQARLAGDLPEIDLQPVTDVQPAFQSALEPGENRIGFATAGVPHLTVLVDDVESVAVRSRGSDLRHHKALSAGANANFVSGGPASWHIRTFERGVEDETLACGTGAVASAVLLRTWGLETGDVLLQTRSGRPLLVRLIPDGAQWLVSLRGEGRIVFSGQFSELA